MAHFQEEKNNVDNNDNDIVMGFLDDDEDDDDNNNENENNSNNNNKRNSKKFNELFRKRIVTYQNRHKINMSNYEFNFQYNAIKCIPCGRFIYDQEKRAIVEHEKRKCHRKAIGTYHDSDEENEKNDIIESATSAIDIINLHPGEENTRQLLDSLKPLISLLSNRLVSKSAKVYEPILDKQTVMYDFNEWKRLMLPKKSNFGKISDPTDRVLQSWANAIQLYRHNISHLIRLFVFVVSIQVSVCENERAHSIRKFIFNIYRNRLSNSMVDKLLRLFINTPDINDDENLIPFIRDAFKEWKNQRKRRFL